jgi:hypothetical protein
MSFAGQTKFQKKKINREAQIEISTLPVDK